MVGSTLAELPHGREGGNQFAAAAAQLRALRPDLAIESVRGNLDTRLRKLDEGQYDAIVLAAAACGGWAGRTASPRSCRPEVMCPAVGQGALAIETRDDGGAGARDLRAAGSCRDARRGDGGAARAGGAGRRLPGADRRARHGRRTDTLHLLGGGGLARRHASHARRARRRRWLMRERSAANWARTAGERRARDSGSGLRHAG